MNRQLQRFCTWLLLCSVVFTGCAPVQPFYLHEDGDLSHYLDTATDIEYPDLCHDPLPDAEFARRPRTLTHPDFDSIWELTLEEAMATTLQNSKVVRQTGFRGGFDNFLVGTGDRLLSNAATPTGEIGRAGPNVATIYDAAIVETGQTGVEQALSQFDAVFNSNTTWDRRDRPQNLSGFTGTTSADQQDRTVINNEITKRSATGSQFAVRNQTIYEFNLDNNRVPGVPGSGNRAAETTWFTAMETEWRQPLLRGAGAQVNRIPIVIARIRTDISLANFEANVRNSMSEVESSYWALYFAYRQLDTAKIGRDSALATWKKIHALSVEEARGGEAQQEAQAREQYFFFRSVVEDNLRQLYRAERNLRYLMGLAATDGRLIRPANEPTTARVTFDWDDIHAEALSRYTELRAQQWRVKQREMELIAARNQLLPQLDVVGIYRWLGQGQELNGSNPDFPDSDDIRNSGAIEQLLNGRYQEGQLGFQLSVPIGFRQGMAQVRNNQLLLARARAALEDMELEASHLLADAVADLESEYEIAQTNLNRRVAAGREVEAMEAAYDTGTVTLDRLLDAQRRRAQAEVEYYERVVRYNEAIKFVHFRKGSLLDYNNVVLAEGPWPNKAYYDSLQRARRRDASYIMDYGYSRPRVVSKGAVPQMPGSAALAAEPPTEIVGEGEVIFEGEVVPQEAPPFEETMPLEELTPPQEATPPEAIEAPIEKLPLEPYIPSPLETPPANPSPGAESAPSDRTKPPFELSPPKRA